MKKMAKKKKKKLNRSKKEKLGEEVEISENVE